MIQNYVACSIQNYGSDAFRFTLRRSVIHPLYTHPARRKESLPAESRPGSVKGSHSPPSQAAPTCKRSPPGRR